MDSSPKSGPLSEPIKIRPVSSRPYAPTVTVVISCYNYAHFLPQAVKSCLTQNEVIVDVIIVDDCSTDSSLAVAKELAAQHPEVTVMAHSQNKGMVETFNDGARAATGEFLVRLDADDLLTPGSLGRATMVAQNHPSVGLVYGHPLHFDTETLPTPRTQATSWTVWPGMSWLRDRCRSGRNVITSPEALMRRALVDELGYQAPLSHTPDMELWLRLSAFSDVAYIHGADQAWHRDHPDSMSAKEVDGLLDLAERQQAFDVLFQRTAGRLPESESLETTVRSTFLNEALQTALLEIDRGLPHPTLFQAYLDIARSISPDIENSVEWANISTRSSEISPSYWEQIMRVKRRLRRRIYSEIKDHQWQRNGVY